MSVGKNAKSQDCDLVTKIVSSVKSLWDKRDCQWTLTPRTLAHSFPHLLRVAAETLRLFVLLPPHGLPLPSVLCLLDTCCCMVLGLHPGPLFLSISLLVNSFSLWLLVSSMCWWLQNTHLWLRYSDCTLMPNGLSGMHIWYGSFAHPGGYVRRTCSSLSNLLYGSFHHLSGRPLHSSYCPGQNPTEFIPDVLSAGHSVGSAFEICQNLTTHHLHCYHPGLSHHRLSLGC